MISNPPVLNADPTTLLRVEVYGVPRPQGSMRLFRGKSGQEVAQHSDATIQWRRVVTEAVVNVKRPGFPPYLGAVTLDVVFHLPRPKGHYGTGRNANTLRPSAPEHPNGPPDLDKLLRLVCDSITDARSVWADDAQVTFIRAAKRYAVVRPGVSIIVRAES